VVEGENRDAGPASDVEAGVRSSIGPGAALAEQNSGVASDVVEISAAEIRTSRGRQESLGCSGNQERIGRSRNRERHRTGKLGHRTKQKSGPASDVKPEVERRSLGRSGNRASKTGGIGRRSRVASDVAEISVAEIPREAESDPFVRRRAGILGELFLYNFHWNRKT
jgi:hypothetical protein